MRPYPGKHLTLQQHVFNYRLLRVRRIVESAFGILVSRFRVFRRPLLVIPEVVDAVVKACTVLHNFFRKRLFEEVHSFRTETSNSNGETEEHQAMECFRYGIQEHVILMLLILYNQKKI